MKRSNAAVIGALFAIAISAAACDAILGGRVHVVWIEEHDDPNVGEGPYEVLYCDRLECSPDSGG